MVWIKIVLSTTSSETFNICFAGGSTSFLPLTQACSSGLESHWITVYGKGVHPFQRPLRQR